MSGSEDTKRDHRKRPGAKTRGKWTRSTRAEAVKKAIEEFGMHYSPTETAAILGMSVQGVRKWIKRGTLKLGEDYFITPTGLVRIRGSTIKRIVGLEKASPITL